MPSTSSRRGRRRGRASPSSAAAAAAAPAAASAASSAPDSVPSLTDLRRHHLSAVAQKHWAVTAADHSAAAKPPFDADLVRKLYLEEMALHDDDEDDHDQGDMDVDDDSDQDDDEAGSGDAASAIAVLELSGYLQFYLWAHFDADASREHILSMIVMINEKARQRLQIWDCFGCDRDGDFAEFVSRAINIASEKPLSTREKLAHITFLITCFQSLEHAVLRKCCLKLVSLALWKHLPEPALRLHLKDNEAMRPHFDALDVGVDAIEVTFMRDRVHDFISELARAAEARGSSSVRFCERFLELSIDLLAMLPTRRFFLAFFQHSLALERAVTSPLFCSERRGAVFRQQIVVLKQVLGAAIDDATGKPLSDAEMLRRHYHRVQVMQRVAFVRFCDELEPLALTNVADVDRRERLLHYLQPLDDAALARFVAALRVLDADTAAKVGERAVLEEALVTRFERREALRDVVKRLPIYPNDRELFDDARLPEVYSGRRSLALPKINLQFLTMPDYLLRNFALYRLESTFCIRQELEAAVRRLKAQAHPDGSGRTVFTGWSRMAVPLSSLSVTKIGKPKIDENKPSEVAATLTVDLAPFQGAIRQEWEAIKPRDVLFLACVRARTDDDDNNGAASDAKIVYVRGCEVQRVLDSTRRVVGEREDSGEVRAGVGTKRVYEVQLDAAQYQEDVDRGVDEEDVYACVNVLLRRRPKHNNFKAVLSCVRSLLERDASLPDWFSEVFLGYGQPDQVVPKLAQDTPLDIGYTCVDTQHVQECFGDEFDVRMAEGAQPPYRLSFPAGGDARVHEGATNADVAEVPSAAQLAKNTVAQLKEMMAPYELDTSGRKAELVERLHAHLMQTPTTTTTTTTSTTKPVLEVTSYEPADALDFAADAATADTNADTDTEGDTMRFTASQVRAICSAMRTGLTLVVGPPGTGKTDVAVQLIANVYHAWPQQRVLLVTHSNHALNDLFAKLARRADLDSGALVRLGHGAAAAALPHDFSKSGRVNALLARRLALLAEVARLARSLGAPRDAADAAASTCSAAAHFYRATIAPLCAAFDADANADDAFPFGVFFARADVRTARDRVRCVAAVRRVFQQLEQLAPFEVLRTLRARADYLVGRYARVVAMTCTHAAVHGEALAARGGFAFDTLVMEEAAQVLDVETAIALLLGGAAAARLQRVVLLGDHQQLPPVLHSEALRRFAGADQSLFTRLLRVGVPHVPLVQQGRARASLADLYRWRYQRLSDLPHTGAGRYAGAVAGLRYEFQFVDVRDFDGRGESAPQRFFYQNLGEAEFIVQVFLYLRLCGHPASSIAVLTTYNGQKHLLQDVFDARCRPLPGVGVPVKITTVDRFQGQQSDIVLLSLVRTKAVGHIRDVRRLVVALSRARLGLYVFGRAQLFRNCFEMAPAMARLCSRPLHLQLVDGEVFPCQRTLEEEPSSASCTSVNDVVHMGQIVYQMQQQQQQPRENAE